MGGRSTFRWIIASAIVVVVAFTAGAGYLVAGTVAAAGDQRAAQDVLKRVVPDERRIAGLLHAPNLRTANLSAARSGIQSDQAQIQAARALVTADVPRLRAASARLAAQAQSPLVAIERSPLSAEGRRIDSLTTALGVADEALALADNHLQLIVAVLDTDAAYGPLVPKLKAGDFKGALVLYSQVDSAVQRELAMAARPNVPPALQSRAHADATYAADDKRYLQAAQASDWKTTDTLDPRLNTELDAVRHIDYASAQTYDDKLFKAYQDRFNAAARASGILGPNSGP